MSYFHIIWLKKLNEISRLEIRKLSTSQLASITEMLPVRYFDRQLKYDRQPSYALCNLYVRFSGAID